MMKIDTDLNIEDEDIVDVLENDDTSTEETGRKSKRINADTSEVIVNINDYLRFVCMSDGVRRLDKLNKYTDGTSGWVFEGWYSRQDDKSMFNKVITLIRDNKLRQNQVNTLKDYIKCFEDAKKEITDYFAVDIEDMKEMK